MGRRGWDFWPVLLLASFASAHDTEGRTYRVVFPRNFEITSTNCSLSIIMMNRNETKDVRASITYYSRFLDLTSLNTTYYTVDAKGFLEISFPHFDAWEYMNGGWQDQFDTRIVITSDGDLTVLAQNMHRDGYGDIFLVLPQSMAGTSYALTLPPAASMQKGANQYTVVYFLPTRKDVDITLNAKFSLGTDLTYFSVLHSFRNEPTTLYITGSAPFLVTAAVTCLQTTSRTCDYAAFMPTPVPDTNCSHSDGFFDIHPTDLTTTRSFSLTPSSQDCPSTASLFNDASSASTPIDGSLLSIPSLFGDRVAIQSTSSRPFLPSFIASYSSSFISAVRVGGLPSQGGAFLSTLPSRSQFVSGSVSFLTKASSDTLYIVASSLSALTMSLDEKQIQFSHEVIIINKAQYSFAVVKVLSPGMHVLSADHGDFIFYVVGSLRPSHLYGYYPAFGSQAGHK